MGKRMETAISKGIVGGTADPFLDSLLTRGKLRNHDLGSKLNVCGFRGSGCEVWAPGFKLLLIISGSGFGLRVCGFLFRAYDSGLYVQGI